MEEPLTSFFLKWNEVNFHFQAVDCIWHTFGVNIRGTLPRIHPNSLVCYCYSAADQISIFTLSSFPGHSVNAPPASWA